MSIKRMYTRCNGGCYFTGTHCQFDGWSSPLTEELAVAAEKLRELSIVPSVDELRKLGVSDAAIERCIIVEFGSEKSTCDAAFIAAYSRDGERIDYAKFGREYM